MMFVIKTEQGLFLDDSGTPMQWHSEEDCENYCELLKFTQTVEAAEVVEDRPTVEFSGWWV